MALGLFFFSHSIEMLDHFNFKKYNVGYDIMAEKNTSGQL
jgi:hypothetical protein